jgi:hypothetical protein
MIDNYIKRLENVISPKAYNMKNYKEKIVDKNQTEKGNNDKNKLKMYKTIK